jgi:uncharacterized protein YggT (Ycf19 family)
MLMLARMVKLVATLVAGVIVLGILLHVFDANSSNALVSAVYDVCRPLVAPFKDLFNLKDAKAQIALNWGIAAAVYALVGALIARVLAMAGLAAAERRPFLRRRRTVV